MAGLAAKFLIPGVVIALLYLVEIYNKKWVYKNILAQTWIVRSLLAGLFIPGSITIGVEATLLVLSVGVLFTLILPNH